MYIYIYICGYIYIYIYIYKYNICPMRSPQGYTPEAVLARLRARGHHTPHHYRNHSCEVLICIEGFERSRSKSSPLEKSRSKLANPVELSWGSAGVSTGVARFDGDLLINILLTVVTLTGHLYTEERVGRCQTRRWSPGDIYIYIYVYIYVCVCVCVCVCVYVCVCVCVYIYIYIYIYIYRKGERVMQPTGGHFPC